MKIFVGNLNWEATEEDVRDFFLPFGDVASVKIITDRETGRARGFAFVDMPNAAQASGAIKSVNGQDFMGRALNVNEARPPAHSARGGFRSGDSWRPDNY